MMWRRQLAHPEEEGGGIYEKTVLEERTGQDRLGSFVGCILSPQKIVGDSHMIGCSVETQLI